MIELRVSYFLNCIVVDNMLGYGFKPITEELTLYRNFGHSSGFGKDLEYKGWVSASNSLAYAEDKDAPWLSVEKFVLPVGFPVVNTMIGNICYADDGEYIVRNCDLIQL